MKPVFAVSIADTPFGSNSISSAFPTIGKLLEILLQNSLTIIGVLLLLFLIYGGLLFIIGAGSGDSKKTQAAAGVIANTAIGFLIVFLAYFIVQIVQLITGVQILNSPL